MPVPTPNKRATITDVAQLAGVSISTVSRVLNSSASVADETVASVRKAIRLLNYKPLAAARSLAGRHSNAIGLLLPEVSGAFFSPLMRGIDAGVRATGVDLLVHLSSNEQVVGLGRAAPLDEHNTAGLLVFTDRLADEEIVRLWDNGFPLVLLYRSAPFGATTPCVMFENQLSTQRLVEHLIVAHGRRRIAFLTGPANNEDSMLREEGYRAALAAHNLPFDPVLVSEGGFAADRAQAAVADWLLNGIEFDAVFAGDDGAAAGAMLALRRAGRRVPADVSVVGYDDIAFASLLDPPLTTIRAPIEESGLLAVQLLIAQTRGEAAPSINVLSTELVIRESCGCVTERVR